MPGDEPYFDWGALVPRVVHPLKLSMVEAFIWIDEPLSATCLCKSLGIHTLGLFNYHLGQLAKWGAVKEVREEQVRGATRHFFVLADPYLIRPGHEP